MKNKVIQIIGIGAVILFFLMTLTPSTTATSTKIKNGELGSSVNIYNAVITPNQIKKIQEIHEKTEKLVLESNVIFRKYDFYNKYSWFEYIEPLSPFEEPIYEPIEGIW